MSFFRKILDSLSLGNSSRRRVSSPKLRINEESLLRYPPSSEGVHLLMNQVHSFAGKTEPRRRGSAGKIPFRRLVIWGWDEKGDPAFLNLYGYHLKERGKETYREEIQYMAMKIWKGLDGRLPSQHKVAFATAYSQRLKESLYYMIEPAGRDFSYSEAALNPYKFRDFQGIPEDVEILLPYFREMDYTRLAQALSEHLWDKGNFRIAENFNEILGLSEASLKYLPLIVEMIQSERVYRRRQLLAQLCSMKAPAEVWDRLLKIGGAEILSGIFMEFAKRKDRSLLAKAEEFLQKEDISFVPDEEKNQRVTEGVRQAAKIYLLCFSEQEREKEIALLREEIPDLFSKSGQNRFGSVSCSVLDIKHQVLKMEAFGEAELLGKLAFLLDRDIIRFSGAKTALYLHRKIRRIADGYAKEDGEKYIAFLLSMISCYSEEREAGSFEVPVYIKKYLYTDFFEGRIDSASDWYKAKTFAEAKDLLAGEQRMEAEKALWEEHIPKLLPLLSSCGEELILHFAGKLLRQSAAGAKALRNLSFEALLPLSELSYAPLAELFSQELQRRPFHPGIFLYRLLESGEEGKKVRLPEMAEEEQLAFLESLYKNAFEALSPKRVCSEELKETFSAIAGRVRSFSEEGKRRISEILCRAALQEGFIGNLSPFMAEFTERLVCSLDIMEIGKVLEAGLYPKTHRLPLLIEDILRGRLPEDERTALTLEEGAPETILRMQELLESRKEELGKRPSTLLLLMESSVPGLAALAQSVLRASEGGERRESLQYLLDSPDGKTSDFAWNLLQEDYGEAVPPEWVLRMMEHSRPEIRAYAAAKIEESLSAADGGGSIEAEKGEVVLYYIHSLLLLPNRMAPAKKRIYESLPSFVRRYPQARERVEALLLDLGGSHTKTDAEKALVALARIRKGESA